MSSSPRSRYKYFQHAVSKISWFGRWITLVKSSRVSPQPPEGGWISLSINIIPSSGLCGIFYTGWRITVNVWQLFGNQEGLNYIDLTWQALRMCGFWKVETIRTNTFMEIAINPKRLNFPLPCLHHSGFPLPNFPFVKGVTHPHRESYRICGKEYGIWSLPGLALQLDCTIS